MKLGQISDKKIDQSEIQSKFFWKFTWNWGSQTIERIDLSTFKIDISWTNPSSYPIWAYITLPKNQFLGLNLWKLGDYHAYLFISDKNYNAKAIEPPAVHIYSPNNFASCFYDDSIFIFESEWYCVRWPIPRKAKRYIISKNKWINLADSPFNLQRSCIGFNQKIVIAADSAAELLIYDILLDSYSSHLPIQLCSKIWYQRLFKISGKIYLLIMSDLKQIYCCDNPFSEWSFVWKINDLLLYERSYVFNYYKGSIYCLIDSNLYEFSLTKFESKKVEIESFNSQSD